ncbi:hypothetical protein QJS10_CPB18g01045 [Acorus calamus]|uniref:Uncharacterized protein n=1 Tax=Acorus calamus TaxID=4465 RepID=A0AAV9CKY0_ACOCL|nr:hypothetical protein QJS10_CPB18g01045 [Acorus calamus]
MDYTRWTTANTTTPPPPHPAAQPPPPLPYSADAYAHPYYRPPPPPYYPGQHYYYPPPNPNPTVVPTPLPPNPLTQQQQRYEDAPPPGVELYVPPQPNPYMPHGGYDGCSVAVTYGYGHDPVGYNVGRKKALAPANTEDLETKRKKVIEEGAEPDSVRLCSICNVVCNSESVFMSHLAGQKHAAKVMGSLPNGPVHMPTAAVHPNPTLVATSRLPKSVFCEVCKIECNTKEVLDCHRNGNKHKKNVMKLEQALTTRPQPPKTEEKAVVVKSKRKKAAEEDVETKKKKLLESGTAADAVKVCKACNVVCNSQTVFDYHVKGQKHLAMVKKQQEEQLVVVA